MMFVITRKRRMLEEMRRLEEDEARRAVANGGRSISPVISNDNLFDIHPEEIEEGFGVNTDRKKDKKSIEEALKLQQEFGVEQDIWPSRSERKPHNQGELVLRVLLYL